MTSETQARPFDTPFHILGRWVVGFVTTVGDLSLFTARMLRWMMLRLPKRAVLLYSFYQIGVLSVPVVVVTGAHRGPIAHDLRDLPIRLVDAVDWREGRTASMQAGLAAIPEDRDVLFWPVDHPFVAESTVDRLVAAPAADLLSVWWIPTYEGRGGHPVLWRSTIRRDLFELRPDAPIRSLLPEFGPQVHRIPVDDPGVVANTDTPEEFRESLEAWLGRGGA